jgi:glutamine amidotransferase
MIKSNIVIVDYQLGNLFSVNQALSAIGLACKISSDPVDIASADALILPGVGAFKDAMQNLNKLGLDIEIKRFIDSKKPFLGICLGLQLLFTSSEEFGFSEGLDIIKGSVKKFSNTDSFGTLVKVPQIAWNTVFNVNQVIWNNSPLMDLHQGEDMYFVHSYFVIPDNKEIIVSKTCYAGIEYVSSIQSDNIFACQFHPEKSGKNGLSIYKKWALINNLI